MASRSVISPVKSTWAELSGHKDGNGLNTGRPSVGGGFSFWSSRSGEEESVGLVGRELRCSHVLVPASR